MTDEKADQRLGEPVHELLCRGARVRIRGCKVEVLTDPAVVSCPYVRAVYGIDRVDREAVRRIIKRKIEEYGHFCPHRSLKSDRIVPFGSSEMISAVMGEILDAAVVVCDGVGTVITENPELVQGIGAAMTGLIRTTPILKVVRRVEGMGGEVLDPPRIDQVEGVRRAFREGFRRVAVTVIGLNAEIIPQLRELEESVEGAKLAIFSTCNTLVPEEHLRYLEMADIVCSSASRLVLRRIRRRALMQLGIGIPVFALTRLGKRIALRYLEEMKSPFVVSRARMPYVIEEKLPTPALDSGESEH